MGVRAQDEIEVFVAGDAALLSALARHAAAVTATLRVAALPLERLEGGGAVIVESEEAVAGPGDKVKIVLTRARYHVHLGRCGGAVEQAGGGTTARAVAEAVGKLETEEIKARLARDGGRLTVTVPKAGGGDVTVELRAGETLFGSLAAMPDE